jgi:hypothetical protein
LLPERVRNTHGGFAYLPNRFLHGGFLASLGHLERSLYLFLVLASDRSGISYYSYDRICTTLEIIPDDYVTARNSLIDKNLIAFDGTAFQVLSLPSHPCVQPRQPLLPEDKDLLEQDDPATIHQIIRASIGVP